MFTTDAEKPHCGKLRRALHEQDDGVTRNEVFDLLAGIRGRASWWPFVASSSTKIAVRAVASVADLDAAAWDGLDHGASPFLRHGFLPRSRSRARSTRGRDPQAALGLVQPVPPGRAGGAAGRRRAGVPQGPQLRRVHLRLGLGERGAARRPALLPQARDRGARRRRRPAAGCCSRRGPTPAAVRTALIARRPRGRRRHRVLVDPLAVLHRRRAGRARRGRVLPARQHAVPLAQPRLRDVRRLPRRSSSRASASSCARSASGPGPRSTG